MAAVPESASPAPSPRLGQKPRYVISQKGTRTTVSVDGVAIRRLSGASVTFEPGGLPSLTLSLIARDGEVEFDQARVVIAGVDMPECIKQALFLHLSDLYEVGQVEVTSLESECCEYQRVAVAR
ncbi:Uncharacterised protein [Achromobacter denitrificans]|uniref:hypothetical protein n=1 Tax=Achromobacter denitrificans TaxID=32002 RepID=UPI00078871BD|nr:hypothetical protein [Achromobacter denitrificans]OLU09089.1 hypothetical protein BVK87_06740 [Achromobacter denitrificans]QKH42462.1 hypothetical protein FOC82_13650 [Achromobacter denitrificans]QKH50394.1 hypothetical protein FOC80_13500 [Achromobacter denitrificans]CAB3662860.1 hypothetical protein LMG1231_00642 [Achromobacter denitrificans]SUU20528.1 Uncharacterised protein [Achromobacter denitrificans]